MIIRSIGIFTNPQKSSARSAAYQVAAFAAENGLSCTVDDALHSDDRLKDLPPIGSSTPDIMVAIGGDGTILRAAPFASKNAVPVLGINLGRVGFLNEIRVDELADAFEKIGKDDFYIDECSMLCCSINGDEPYHCLNEAVLYRKNFSGVISIDVSINDTFAGSVDCDGLIVSTPTGATGYSISAGAPIIAPDTDVTIITPICPHTLAFRPIIASSNAAVTLSTMNEGFVAMDGVSIHSITPTDSITIKKSDRTVRFMRFGERNLFGLIREKLS